MQLLRIFLLRKSLGKIELISPFNGAEPKILKFTSYEEQNRHFGNPTGRPILIELLRFWIFAFSRTKIFIYTSTQDLNQSTLA
jgi:hypothetical protein